MWADVFMQPSTFGASAASGETIFVVVVVVNRNPHW